MLEKYLGNCHCNAIIFEFYCKTEINLIQCNCSICIHTNYLHLIVPHENFKLLKGDNVISTYQFNSKSAKHFFCSICGIKSFYQPRSHKNSYSINYNSIKKRPKIKKIINFNGKNYEMNLGKIKNIS